jgi:hypothetical protein
MVPHDLLRQVRPAVLIHWTREYPALDISRNVHLIDLPPTLLA